MAPHIPPFSSTKEQALHPPFPNRIIGYGACDLWGLGSMNAMASSKDGSHIHGDGTREVKSYIPFVRVMIHVVE